MNAPLRPLWLALTLVGCPAEPAPDRVRIELPPLVTNGAAVRPLVRAHRGTTSTTVAVGSYTLRSEAPAVASATSDGSLSCKKSGDARIAIGVLGVEDRGVVHCRLVARLQVVDVPLLDLAKGPVSLSAHALNADGAELSDVPVLISPSNRQPLSVKGLELVPVAVGTTDVLVRAGDIEHRFATRVVRSVDVVASPVRGGRRLELALPAGKYEVEVALKAPSPLRMDWRGLRQCAYSATGALHRSTCTLEDNGAVVVDNPVFVENGDTALAKERILVREVP